MRVVYQPLCLGEQGESWRLVERSCMSSMDAEEVVEGCSWCTMIRYRNDRDGGWRGKRVTVVCSGKGV